MSPSGQGGAWALPHVARIWLVLSIDCIGLKQRAWGAMVAFGLFARCFCPCLAVYQWDVWAEKFLMEIFSCLIAIYLPSTERKDHATALTAAATDLTAHFR